MLGPLVQTQQAGEQVCSTLQPVLGDKRKAERQNRKRWARAVSRLSCELLPHPVFPMRRKA